VPGATVKMLRRYAPDGSSYRARRRGNRTGHRRRENVCDSDPRPVSGYDVGIVKALPFLAYAPGVVRAQQRAM